MASKVLSILSGSCAAGDWMCLWYGPLARLSVPARDLMSLHAALTLKTT